MEMNIVKSSLELLNQVKRNPTLKGSEYRIYEYMISHAKDTTAECFLLNRTICKDTGLHLVTVRRAIKNLIAKGYILKQMRTQQYTNENASNLYTICDMLDDFSLEVKKAYVAAYPKIKINADVDALIEQVFLDVTSQNETVEGSVEVIETIETTETEEIQVAATEYDSDFVNMVQSNAFGWCEEYVNYAKDNYNKSFTISEIRRLADYGMSKFQIALEKARVRFGNAFTYTDVRSILNNLNKERGSRNEMCYMW